MKGTNKMSTERIPDDASVSVHVGQGTKIAASYREKKNKASNDRGCHPRSPRPRLRHPSRFAYCCWGGTMASSPWKTRLSSVALVSHSPVHRHGDSVTRLVHRFHFHLRRQMPRANEYQRHETWSSQPVSMRPDLQRYRSPYYYYCHYRH